MYISCQKELSCEDCKSYQPPIANAGKDTTIVLPVDFVTLDGSASSDPDGTISEWLWTKVSGPASFIITKTSGVKTVVKNITNANAVQAQVTNLAQGVYLFELKVTDAGGLFSKDTMQITVNTIYVAGGLVNAVLSN